MAMGELHFFSDRWGIEKERDEFYSKRTGGGSVLCGSVAAILEVSVDPVQTEFGADWTVGHRCVASGSW